MRVIDADELKRRIRKTFYSTYHGEIFEVIDSIPTVNTVKHGRWKKHNSIFSVCSCCFYLMDISCGNKKNYCPCCGARMDGDSNA